MTEISAREKFLAFAVGLLVFHLALTVLGTRFDTFTVLLEPDAVQYARMAKQIRQGSLMAEGFSHGIGMPMLGLFGTYNGNPFLLPSMLLFALTTMHLYLLLRIFLRVEWAHAALLLLLATTPMLKFYLGSVNNIFTSTLLIYLSSLIFRNQILTTWHGLGLGFLFGLDFASRYVDPVLLLPALLILLVRTLAQGGASFTARTLGIFLAAALPWLGVTLYFHQSVLGDFRRTPYQTKTPFVDRVGIGSEGIATHLTAAHDHNEILRNFYQLFVNPRDYALRDDVAGVKPVFRRMPYLAFFFLGLFYIFRRIKPSWLVVLPYGVMAVTFLAFYLSFWPVSAHDLKFGCLRYLLGWYSLAGIVCLRALQMLIADLVTLPPKRRLRHALLAIGFGLTPLTLIAAIEPVDRWQLSRALIDQQRVTLRASSNPGSTRAALDGKLETAWHTQEAMRAGDWVEIRLDRVEQVSEIRLDLQRRAEESFPWRIRAFLDDGSGKWIPITNLRTGRHNHIWRVIFPRRALRAIRIEIIQPSHPARWWIHELSVRR